MLGWSIYLDWYDLDATQLDMTHAPVHDYKLTWLTSPHLTWLNLSLDFTHVDTGHERFIVYKSLLGTNKPTYWGSGHATTVIYKTSQFFSKQGCVMLQLP